MNLFIEVLDGDLQGTRTPVREGMTFGRKGCDVNIQDPKVSSKHARIDVRPDGSIWLVDLGSQNGIRVDKLKALEIPLRSGLQFRLGQTSFRVHDLGGDSDFAGPEDVKRAWFEAILSLAEKGIANAPMVTKQLLPYPHVLKLSFSRGIQSGLDWYLGYGPRDVGGSSVDLPLFEPNAPAKCFQIKPEENEAVLKVHADALGKVLLNGRFVETSSLKPGDMIDIGNTRIEIQFEG